MPEDKKLIAEEGKEKPQKAPQQSSSIDSLQKSFKEEITTFMSHKETKVAALGSKNSQDFLGNMHDYMRGDKEKAGLLLKMKTAIDPKNPEKVSMDQIIEEFGDIEVSANLALKEYVDIYVESIKDEEAQKVVYMQRRQKLLNKLTNNQQKMLFKQHGYLKKDKLTDFGGDSKKGQIHWEQNYLSGLFRDIARWLEGEDGIQYEQKNDIYQKLLGTSIKVVELDYILQKHYNNDANIKKNMKAGATEKIKDVLTDKGYIKKIYPTFVANSVALSMTQTVEDELAMNKEYDRDMLDAVTGNTMYTLLGKKFPIGDFRKRLKRGQIETMFSPENKKKKLREKAYIYYVIGKLKGSTNSSDAGLRMYLQELLDHKLSTTGLSTAAKDGLLQRQMSQQAPHMQQAYMSKVMARYIGEKSNEKITEGEVKWMEDIYTDTRKQLYRMDEAYSDVDVAGRSGVKLRFSGRDMKFGRQSIDDIATIGTDFGFAGDVELIFPENVDQNKKAEVQAAFAAAFGLDQGVYKTRMKQSQFVDPYGQMVPPGSNTLCTSVNHFMLFCQLKQIAELDPEAVQDVFGRTPEEKRDTNARQVQDLFHTGKNKTEAEILAATAKNLGIKQKDISREFLRSSFVSFEDFYKEHSAVYRQDEKNNKKDLDGLQYLSQRHKSSADGLPAWNWKGQVYMNRAYFQSKYGIDYDQEKREISFGEGEGKRTLTKTQRNVLWLSVSRYFGSDRVGGLPELDAEDRQRLATDGYDITNLDNDLRALLGVRAELEKLKNHEDMHTFLQLHGFEYQTQSADVQTIYRLDEEKPDGIYTLSDGQEITVQEYLRRYMGVSSDVLMVPDSNGMEVGLTHELLCMVAEGQDISLGDQLTGQESTSLAPYDIVRQDSVSVTFRTRQPTRRDLEGLELPIVEHTVRIKDIEENIQSLIVGNQSGYNTGAKNFSFKEVSNQTAKTIAQGVNLHTGKEINPDVLNGLRAARGNNVHGTGDGLDTQSAQGLTEQEIIDRYFTYAANNGPCNHPKAPQYSTSLKQIFDNGDFDAFESKADYLYDKFTQELGRLGMAPGLYSKDRTWANRHIAKAKFIHDNWTTGENYSTKPRYSKYTQYVGDPLSGNLDGFIVNSMLGREGLQNMGNLNLSPADSAQIDAIIFDNNGVIRAIDDLSSLELAQAGAILRSATVVPPANPSTTTQGNNQNSANTNATNTTNSAASNNPNTTNNVNNTLSSFGHFEIAKRGEGAFDTDPDKADAFVKKNPTDRYIIDTGASMFSYIGKYRETYPNPILDVSVLGTTPTKPEIDAFVKRAEKFCTNEANEDGSTVWYPQDPDSDLNIGSQISDPAMRKYFRDEMLKMSDDVNRPYNDAKYTQNHERKKKEDKENKRRKEEQDLKDAAAKEQERISEEAANMSNIMNTLFADLPGDSRAGFEDGTRIFVGLTESLMPPRIDEQAEFVECKLEVDESTGKFALKIVDSTFDAHRTVDGSRIEFDTVDEWRGRHGKQNNVWKFAGNMDSSGFGSMINSGTNHTGVMRRSLKHRSDGRLTKNDGSPMILKETDLDNDGTNQPVTRIGYLPDIEGREDKDEKGIALDVERGNDGVTVTMHDGSRSKNMSYGAFATFIASHDYRPYTAAEVERSQSPLDEASEDTQVSFWSKLSSIGSWITAIKKIKQFYTDDYSKRREEIDGARALRALTGLVPEGAGMGLGELKARAQSDLDGVMRSQIQKFKDSLTGKGGGDDGGEAHGAVVSSLIEKQVFQNYSNQLEFKHKAAGYLLYALEGGGPYFRKLAPHDGKGAWVKALFGEEKQKMFLAEQQKRYEMMKASGDVTDRNHEEMLIRGEMRFIQTYASKGAGEKIWGSKFHRAVEGYADKFSESSEADSIADSQIGKGTPEQVYKTTFGPGAIGNNNPKLCLGALKAMERLTETPADYNYLYKAIIATMVTGMTAFKFDKNAKDYFKGLCRRVGIPVGLLVGDMNHPEQIMGLIDYVSHPDKSLTDVFNEQTGENWNISQLTPGTFRREVNYDGKKMDYGRAMLKSIDRWRGPKNSHAGRQVVDALNFKSPRGGGQNRLIRYASDGNLTPKQRGHIHSYIKDGMFNGYTPKSDSGGDMEADSPFITESMLNMNPGVFYSRMIQGLSGANPDYMMREAWTQFKNKGKVFDEYLDTLDPNTDQVEKQELLKIVTQRFFALLSKSEVNSNIDEIKNRIRLGLDTGKRTAQQVRGKDDTRGYKEIIIDSLGSRRQNLNSSNNNYVPVDQDILIKEAVDAVDVYTTLFKKHFEGLSSSAVESILNFRY